MKVTRNGFFLGLFFLLVHHCVAQRGYNYARPIINSGSTVTATGGSNVANFPTTAVANPLRPIVSPLPSANAATIKFSATPTAFGAPSNTNAGSPTTAFGAFQGQVQNSGLSSSASTTPFASGFGAGASAGLQGRTTVTQRPQSGLFGSTSARGPPTQFISGTTTAADNRVDADYESVGDFSAIPGVPGVDYPIYSQVPETSFNCLQQSLPGYYADIEAQCQVFHICALNRTYSFLCPNGTVFSQETLVCVWWNQYDCSSAPALYANNAFIYDYDNEAVPSNSGTYQGSRTKLASGSTTPQQSNFEITGTGRTIAGVGVRPKLAMGGFSSIRTTLTPSSTTTFVSGNALPSTIQFQQTSAIPAVGSPSFSGAQTTINAPKTIVGRAGSDAAGVSGTQRNTFETAQFSTLSTNREYLPPAGRS